VEETVLQFGTGKFLRSFADLFIHEANGAGRDIGRVVAVQSTQSQRGAWLNQQRGAYHVLLRGIVNGVEVDEIVSVASVSRALVAAVEWDRVLEVARSSHLQVIVSNVTEVGYRDVAAGEGGDSHDDDPPRSFPARLTAILKERHAANLPGLTVLPCELIERNGDHLRQLVLQTADRWQLGADFLDWVEVECHWANCLVDRIVTGPPQEHELLSSDQLLSVAEPFAFWAVELADGETCPIDHEAVQVVDDVDPYALRKVRILNGAHTALACKALPLHFETVRQCVTDSEIGPWLEALLTEEILPVLVDRIEDGASFAAETLERFRNPFIEHDLAAIAWEQEAKVQTRLLPTYHEYKERFGREPPILQSILGEFIDFAGQG
jgi:tagaturonate reductase